MFIPVIYMWLIARYLLCLSTNYVKQEIESPVVVATRDVTETFPLATLSTNRKYSGIKPNPYNHAKSDTSPTQSLLHVMLLLGGDIEMNPGPGLASIFSCGYCELPVTWEHSRALCCDGCDVWYHGTCIDMCTQDFEYYAQENVAWICPKCDNINHLNSLYHSYEFELSNYYNPLSDLADDSVMSIPSIKSVFSPIHHSSPTSSHTGDLVHKQRSKSTCLPPSVIARRRRAHSAPVKTTTPNEANTQVGPVQKLVECDKLMEKDQVIAPLSGARPTLSAQSTLSPTPESPASGSETTPSHPENLPSKSNNWRTLVINCNSIVGKRAEFGYLLEYTNPDAIILTETKIDETVYTSEFLPGSYRAFRKDRKMGGGGVLVAIKSQYSAEEVQIESNCETVWAKVSLKQQKKLIIGAFYRQPNNRTAQVEELDKALTQLAPSLGRDCTLILGGDFNVGDIDWNSQTVSPNSHQKAVSEKTIQVLGEHHLHQMVREPTRESRTLDLFCINKPSLNKAVNVIPGLSDHDIIVSDSDIKPQINKKPPRRMHLFTKADWEKIKDDTHAFKETYLKESVNNTVNECWESIKKYLQSVLEQHIPSKMTSSRYNLPYMTNELRRMCNKKQRLWNRAKKTDKKVHWDKYAEHEKSTTKAIRQAKWNYVNNILSDSLAENNPRPFWRYIKSQKQDSFGVAPLKESGVVHSDPLKKAEILNRQFESVFTREDDSAIPQMQGPRYPSIDPLCISVPGVEKMLHSINPSKASGPDALPCRLLKELATPLAPVFTDLFRKSLDSGELPDDWQRANVSPVFKKGNRHLPENYRPISLTCVTCKLLEHIVSKHINSHLEKHSILTRVQHGFRKAHSCETQLLITLQDLASNWDRKVQSDVLVLDFSKAFDTVPHNHLLAKLYHYGIDASVLTWIGAFLKGRTQRVMVDGQLSSPVDVLSGVPQGTVLGPLLFLLHINDLPSTVQSTTRLFADDCLLYRAINSQQDQVILQNDLTKLEQWGKAWGMQFNAKKCNLLRLSRERNPITQMYTLGNHVLEEVESAKYLGLTISNDLKWVNHIAKTTAKANSVLGFLRRNLKGCPQSLRETAYKSMVRSVLEYASPIWDPYYTTDINNLENIQRRGARFVKANYDYTASVTEMLVELGWDSLSTRRVDARLVLFFKVVHGLVDVSAEDLVPHTLQPADTRTRANHQFKYRHLAATTTAYRNSFFPRTIGDWNRLDCDVEQDKVEPFKRQLLNSRHPTPR